MIDPFKHKVLARLKKARGQIDGLIKMIDGDQYCIDILTQILALNGSMRGISNLTLESHLNTCGSKNLASNDPEVRQKFIKEVLKAWDLSSR